jgi:hypothetical protein
VDRLLGEKGIAQDSVAGRQEFGLQMEQRRTQEEGWEYRQIRRGWGLGSVEFRAGGSCWPPRESGWGANHYGLDRQEKAERMVREGLISERGG